MLSSLASRASLVLLVSASTAACGGHRVVPLLSSAGIPVTSPTGAVPLEVVTRSTGVRDPLPVNGASVSYAQFEEALGHAVSTAAVPWAKENQGRRPGGWQLFVEVVQAEAEQEGSRLLVTIGVRATLRARVGGAHLAQTEAACRDGAIVEPGSGAAVLYACMRRIGRDLSGWLATADPDAQPASALAAPEPTSDIPVGAGVGPIGASGAHPDTDGDGDSDAPGEDD